MVYIAKDGTVYDKEPWGFNRLIKLFYWVVLGIICFFKSLVGLDVKPVTNGSGGSSSYKGGGGGGGGGGGPFRPGGGGPSKRIFTMRDINPPTVGGCPGGRCGMR